MTKNRILLVDDDAALLDGLCRHHRKHFDLVAACGPLAGLKAAANDGPFAAIVSDYQMPEMNGTDFLAEVRELRPDTVRIMLTGQADLHAAIEAVNRGHIFRFLTKPVATEDFRSCLDAAVEQFELRRAEQVLLEETLRGSIEVLSEVLALSNPRAFGRATRIRDFVRGMARRLGLHEVWRFETAALLSQIGCVAVPDDIVDRLAAGDPLADKQLAIYERHPDLARELLCKIPRLADVADMVAQQRIDTPYSPSESSVVKGGRLLALALEFDDLLAVGAKPHAALQSLEKRTDCYPPEMLQALRASAANAMQPRVQRLRLGLLRVGMILEQDVKDRTGRLIAAQGHELSVGSLERIRNYANLGTIEQTELMARTPSVKELEAPRSAA